MVPLSGPQAVSLGWHGWSEPLFQSTVGLTPPGVMIVYAPRDEQEMAVCEWLFQVSYTSLLGRTDGSTPLHTEERTAHDSAATS